MSATPLQILDETPFADAAAEVARRVRSAASELLEQLPDSVLQGTGSELAAALDIDVNLAWKLLNISRPGTPASVLQRMPGEAGIRIVLRAAEARGVLPSTIAGMQEAFGLYTRLLEKHAGDRSALDSLLAHVEGSPRRSDVSARRAAFRANSAIVGVQAETQIATYIFWPEQLPDGRRSSVAAVIRGLGGFSRLRGDVCWIIGKGRRSDQKGQLYGQHVPTPIDMESAAAFGGVPLVRDLTSGGIPPVERTLMPDGTTVDRLLPGPVGRSSALTFFLAETIRPGLAEPNDPDNPTLRLVTSSHTPTELQVVDVLFHKDLPAMGAISFGLASELGGISAGFVPPGQRVMIHDAVTLEQHGSDIAGMHVPGLPQYPKLLSNICGRLNIASRDFAAYRIRVAFSPIPCALLFEREMKPS